MPRTLCPSNNTDNNKDDNAQILVSVLNPLSPKKAATEEPVEEQTQPTITLEVSPSSFRSPLSSPIHLVRFGAELRNLVSIMILQQVPGLTFPPDDTNIVIIMIIIIRFLASPTQPGASPQLWKCKPPLRPLVHPRCPHLCWPGYNDDDLDDNKYDEYDDIIEGGFLSLI